MLEIAFEYAIIALNKTGYFKKWFEKIRKYLKYVILFLSKNNRMKFYNKIVFHS